MDKLLDAVYYNTNSPACFAGVNAVYREAKKRNPKIKQADVREYLERQHAYTSHKPVRRKFSRNKFIAHGVDTNWQADLCDMQKLAKYNEGYKYILTCVDVLSKYVWGVPIKDKQAYTVAQAFSQILKKGRKPWWLYTDNGKEFTGKAFQDLMVKKRIVHYTASSYPEVKCPNVERFNRTLKTRLWKYFTQRKTFRYLNVLQTIISSINHSVSQPIGMRPVDVTKENEAEVIQKLFNTDKKKKKQPFKYKVGDPVRIAKEKGKFAKGYEPNFTKEVFTVTECLARDPPVYRIQDKDGEVLTGLFYAPELVRAVPDTARVKRYR
jgi:hypothetical protein